jgi:hypothetical protein
MSNISLIKLLTFIRISSWCFSLSTLILTRTLFIIQTWSKTFVLILILNVIFSLLNLITYHHRGYYRKIKRLLVIFLPLLTICTVIVYILYMCHIYYRIMNLLTLDLMTNDRNESLLSKTFVYYKCCRIQEDILFDSVNERDYFSSFPHCQKSIEENQWNHIKTCGPIFRSIILNIRIAFSIDLIFNIILSIISLIYILEETDEWIDNNRSTLLITNNTNYKIK